MSILILAEHDNHALKSATYSVVKAAQSLPGEIVLLVAGLNCQSVVEEAASLEQVTKVIQVDDKLYQYPLAEEFAALVQREVEGFAYCLAPATTFGKNIFPRVAALLGVSQLSDVIQIHSEDTFSRPIYAGNAIEQVCTSEMIKVITIRPTAFDSVAKVDAKATIESHEALPGLHLSEYIALAETKSERPELTSAKVVVSGGRGLQSRENFEIIEKLADKLNAAIGASRAAVDAGFVPNDYQVGQTGKVVAPELYIAIGISGAIQHVAGMKESKVIVAINKDEEAPIFEVSDYGLVGDLFEMTPELIEKI